MNRPNKKHSLPFFSKEKSGEKKTSENKTRKTSDKNFSGAAPKRSYVKRGNDSNRERDSFSKGRFSEEKSFDRDSRKPKFSDDRSEKKRFTGERKTTGSFAPRPQRDKSSTRYSENAEKPRRSYGSTERKPSRFNDEGRKPSRFNDEGRKPSRFNDEGRKPSRFNDEGRKPSRFNDEGRKPSRFNDEGSQSSRFNDEGRKPSRFNDEGRKPPKFNDEGRKSSGYETSGDRKRPTSTRNTGTREGNPHGFGPKKSTERLFKKTGTSSSSNRERKFADEEKEFSPRVPRYGNSARSSSLARTFNKGKFSVKKRSDKKNDSPEAVTGNPDDIRLNKYISNSGICSRREADKLIESGAVTVNSIIVTELGHKIKSHDIVHIGGDLIRNEKKVYVLLNKPKDYITTSSDPGNRRTVMQLVADACRERIYPVGRLDRNTTGLLLFTNDGELTKKLTHPRYGIEKIYHVELDKPLARIDLTAIRKGLELEDGLVQVDEVDFVEGAGSKREVGIKLHSGKNRVVRRIFEHLGYHVVKLDRVVFAGLTKKDLPRGKWRVLSGAEVSALFAQS